MKNINRDVYSVIRKSRESSYGFMKNASFYDIRYYNSVIKRIVEITRQIGDMNGLYGELDIILKIKYEANIHAANHPTSENNYQYSLTK